MKLKSAIIISAVLLFVSSPAWGDSMKFEHKNSPDAIHFLDNSPKTGHSDIFFLSGFNKDNGNHYGFFKSKQGRFKLYNPGGQSDVPAQDPTSTPEPASLSLLLVGMIGIGAFAMRRNPSAVAAQ
jgi:PEP-CTERM motif